MPSNEGRGYVLRRLLRRAARHGRLLGIHRSFLAEIANTVIDENANAYPELAEKRDMITKLISVEEESFAKTIDQGLQMLNEFIENSKEKVFSGADAFRLNDTYGFPLDLTKEIVAERGMLVDEEEFKSLMLQQRERARAARKNAGADAWAGENSGIEDLPATNFVGYEKMTAEAKVIGIIKNGESVSVADQGDEVVLALDTTPFYAESGGQVGDTGALESEGLLISVDGTTKSQSGIFLHHAYISNGQLTLGQGVTARVDIIRRRYITRNHTAAHLLQASLRNVLGTHVEQAGQLVNPDHLRFDFTHFAALTPEQLVEVELQVNKVIFNGIPVECREMPIEEAKKLGAMALFGEKYGKIVRVVSVGDYSREFCGGTHVDNTAKIGLFKIVSEGSVASGVRRIEAVTGMGVLNLLNTSLQTIEEAAMALKLNSSSDLVKKAQQVSADLKEKDREIEALNAKIASMQIEGLFENVTEICGVKIITAMFSGTTPDALRSMCDRIRDISPDMVAVLASSNQGKVNFAATAGKEAVKKGVHAGKLVGQVAKIAGGNGGGKPDMAMAGAKNPNMVDEALAAVEGFITAMTKAE